MGGNSDRRGRQGLIIQKFVSYVQEVSFDFEINKKLATDL